MIKRHIFHPSQETAGKELTENLIILDFLITQERHLFEKKDIEIENLCELLYISQLNHYKIVSNCREIKTIATSTKRVHAKLEWVKKGADNYNNGA